MKIRYYLMLVCISSTYLYANSPYIEWKVENPFRFFKESHKYWEMKELYDLNKNKEPKIKS